MVSGNLHITCGDSCPRQVDTIHMNTHELQPISGPLFKNLCTFMTPERNSLPDNNNGATGPGYYPKAVEPDLETCEALIFHLNDGLTSVVVWKNKPSLLKPLEKVKRLRDLKAGDRVSVWGREFLVRSVEVFR